MMREVGDDKSEAERHCFTPFSSGASAERGVTPVQETISLLRNACSFRLDFLRLCVSSCLDTAPSSFRQPFSKMLSTFSSLASLVYPSMPSSDSDPSAPAASSSDVARCRDVLRSLRRRDSPRRRVASSRPRCPPSSSLSPSRQENSEASSSACSKNAESGGGVGEKSHKFPQCTRCTCDKRGRPVSWGDTALEGCRESCAGDTKDAENSLSGSAKYLDIWNTPLCLHVCSHVLSASAERRRTPSRSVSQSSLLQEIVSGEKEQTNDTAEVLPSGSGVSRRDAECGVAQTGRSHTHFQRLTPHASRSPFSSSPFPSSSSSSSPPCPSTSCSSSSSSSSESMVSSLPLSSPTCLPASCSFFVSAAARQTSSTLSSPPAVHVGMRDHRTHLDVFASEPLDFEEATRGEDATDAAAETPSETSFGTVFGTVGAGFFWSREEPSRRDSRRRLGVRGRVANILGNVPCFCLPLEDVISTMATSQRAALLTRLRGIEVRSFVLENSCFFDALVSHVFALPEEARPPLHLLRIVNYRNEDLRDTLSPLELVRVRTAEMALVHQLQRERENEAEGLRPNHQEAEQRGTRDDSRTREEGAITKDSERSEEEREEAGSSTDAVGVGRRGKRRVTERINLEERERGERAGEQRSERPRDRRRFTQSDLYNEGVNRYGGDPQKRGNAGDEVSTNSASCASSPSFSETPCSTFNIRVAARREGASASTVSSSECGHMGSGSVPGRLHKPADRDRVGVGREARDGPSLVSNCRGDPSASVSNASPALASPSGSPHFSARADSMAFPSFFSKSLAVVPRPVQRHVRSLLSQFPRIRTIELLFSPQKKFFPSPAHALAFVTPFAVFAEAFGFELLPIEFHAVTRACTGCTDTASPRKSLRTREGELWGGGEVSVQGFSGAAESPFFPGGLIRPGRLSGNNATRIETERTELSLHEPRFITEECAAFSHIFGGHRLRHSKALCVCCDEEEIGATLVARLLSEYRAKRENDVRRLLATRAAKEKTKTSDTNEGQNRAERGGRTRLPCNSEEERRSEQRRDPAMRNREETSSGKESGGGWEGPRRELEEKLEAESDARIARSSSALSISSFVCTNSEGCSRLSDDARSGNRADGRKESKGREVERGETQGAAGEDGSQSRSVVEGQMFTQWQEQKDVDVEREPEQRRDRRNGASKASCTILGCEEFGRRRRHSQCVGGGGACRNERERVRNARDSSPPPSFPVLGFVVRDIILSQPAPEADE
ncbi:UNVERIFIED_CONTAM: hypothetical protein HHA_211610 [Hammondia hammondi]|eukprot:XP_008885297.1 hypothetical protein HHA_211610 [Hammondia hammondi]